LAKNKSRSKTGGASAHRNARKSTSAKVKRWRWIIDNDLEHFGEVDHEARIVRINVDMHRRTRESLLDTFIHEHLHIKYPRLSERQVLKLTECTLGFMTASYRRECEARYRRHLRKSARLALAGTRH
jgi:hypothetical protein